MTRRSKPKDSSEPPPGPLDEAEAALVERLAVRIGPHPGRPVGEAVDLEGVSDHPRLAELVAAALRHTARGRSREYALGVVTETRLLALLRIREALGRVPEGALSQLLSALEKTSEGLGPAQPRTQLTLNRIIEIVEREERKVGS